MNHRGTEGTETGIGLRGREFATTQNDASSFAAVVGSDMSRLTGAVIGAAIEVHKALGPGLLESAYEECLCRELALREIPFERQKALPVLYKGLRLDCGYRLDLIVEDAVIVELKACDELLAVHQAQLLTYLKLTGLKVGLLINFNVPVLKDGIRRLAM